MNKYRKTILIAGIAIVVVAINLFAFTRFNLAYGPFDWKILSVSYPIPPVTMYFPFITN